MKKVSVRCIMIYTMYRPPSKRKQAIRHALIYTLMTLSVVVLVTAIILFILGFRFDSGNGRLEQGALLQFATEPSGAMIEVDGKAINPRTPAKYTVLAGEHTFRMSKDGYEVWNKTLDVKAGMLTWLNYARLIPVNRPVETVASYTSLSGMTTSPDGKIILSITDASQPNIQVADIRSSEVKLSTITLPAALYTDATTKDVVHTFTLGNWDTGGRYALVNHAYSGKSEWLVVDTRDVSASKNITRVLDIDIASPVFSGTNGNVVYALSAGDIRKLDLAAATISRSLVSGVTAFSLYDNTIITYEGKDTTDATKHVVGVYREGDSAPHILRSVSTDLPLKIATSRYYNQDYVAIAEGSRIDILRGSYPSSSSDDTTSLGIVSTVDFTPSTAHLSFSPEGDYVLAQTNASFVSYDVEHARVNRSIVGQDANAAMSPLRWIDDDHLWSDAEGQLTLREFDGANTTVISPAALGFGAVISENETYMYSIGKTDSGYQLQRVRLTLP